MDLWEEGDGVCCLDKLRCHQGLHPVTCHGAKNLHHMMNGVSLLPEKTLHCAPIRYKGVATSPYWGDPRGNRVLGVYRSDAPWTWAWSSVHPQHGPDTSIILMHPTRTLEALGKKAIVIRTTTNNTKSATVVLTIMAAGDQLVPMVVYNGMENGSIKKCKLTLNV